MPSHHLRIRSGLHTEPFTHTAGLRRAGWLRAAVLGADDGIVSTAALMIGVASAGSSRTAILTAGLAGLTAGAASMAVGEYVSVSSQRDVERTALDHERRELELDPAGETSELAGLYEHQGVQPELARRVASQVMAADALGAHAREELGLTTTMRARPWQAAGSSACAFVVGAIVPLLGLLGPTSVWRVGLVVGLSLVALAATGALAARVGGAPAPRGAARVAIGGGLAMAVSALIGHLVGVVV